MFFRSSYHSFLNLSTSDLKAHRNSSPHFRYCCLLPPIHLESRYRSSKFEIHNLAFIRRTYDEKSDGSFKIEGAGSGQSETRGGCSAYCCPLAGRARARRCETRIPSSG